MTPPSPNVPRSSPVERPPAACFLPQGLRAVGTPVSRSFTPPRSSDAERRTAILPASPLGVTLRRKRVAAPTNLPRSESTNKLSAPEPSSVARDRLGSRDAFPSASNGRSRAGTRDAGFLDVSCRNSRWRLLSVAVSVFSGTPYQCGVAVRATGRKAAPGLAVVRLPKPDVNDARPIASAWCSSVVRLHVGNSFPYAGNSTLACGDSVPVSSVALAGGLDSLPRIVGRGALLFTKRSSMQIGCRRSALSKVSSSTRSIKRESYRVVGRSASMSVAPSGATKDGETRCEIKCWIRPETFGGTQTCR